MVCTHLRQLYHLCEQNGVRISSSDLVHIVCDQCGVKEVCPSMLMTEYEKKDHEANQNAAKPAADSPQK